MVITVFEINQDGAVLKVDEVKLIDKLIFADRFDFCAALFLRGSAGNLVNVILYSLCRLFKNYFGFNPP